MKTPKKAIVYKTASRKNRSVEKKNNNRRYGEPTEPEKMPMVPMDFEKMWRAHTEMVKTTIAAEVDRMELSLATQMDESKKSMMRSIIANLRRGGQYMY